MLYRLIIGVVAVCLMSVPVSAQSPAPKDLATRVEVYSFPSGIPSFLGMGEVDPDVWHLKYRSTEAAM